MKGIFGNVSSHCIMYLNNKLIFKKIELINLMILPWQKKEKSKKKQKLKGDRETKKGDKNFVKILKVNYSK